MTDVIKLLPDHVANQIAAGEVVQRPASVVKELLENAVDAKATLIKLIVKEGGKSLIQVIDNGQGMTQTDARFCFERHATSKISSADDLFDLHTKGFRGEALASIAAIAHVDLKTKTTQAELGSHIQIEGSTVVSQEVVAAPQGTSIAVKNLFFNVPARRKFLKSKQVEFRHILDEFHRIALVYPEIEFHLYHDGTELFKLLKANQRQRICHIFGSRMNERLVPVNEETEVVTISGFICKPEFAKKSRGEQFFFANDRFIKSPYLHHAVMAAFEGFIKPSTLPGYFLYLKVNPTSIDVNIHPTKTEVKFDDEQTLYAILRSAVKHSLGQFNVVPTLDFSHDPNMDTPYAYTQKRAVTPQVTVDRSFNPFSTDKGGNSVAGVIQQNGNEAWKELYKGLDSAVTKDFSRVEFESDTDQLETLFSADSEEAASGATVFQLKRKYVVSTLKSGMLIINQQRAHQRVLYERFLKDITIQQGMTQQLLFPIELQYSLAEISVLQEIRDSLIHMGFAIEIDGETIRFKGLPVLITEEKVTNLMDVLIADYKEGISADNISQAEILARSLSQNLSIKTGERLEKESQLALVHDLFACKDTVMSPFQRKIYTTISDTDIEKQLN